jgi:hypothetical protein
MDEKLFFGVIIYLFLSVGTASFLPSGFYTGTSHSVPNQQEFQNIATEQMENVDSFTGQLSFFQKILTYIFVTWTISGIPVIVSLLILFFNLFSLTVVSIFIYDKLRGIS